MKRNNHLLALGKMRVVGYAGVGVTAGKMQFTCLQCNHNQSWEDDELSAAH